MAPAEIVDLAKASLVLVLTIAGPLLLASLITGVTIGILQALTQVQEATLTFVPKLMVMGLVLLLSLPSIGQALAAFTTHVSDLIVRG